MVDLAFVERGELEAPTSPRSFDSIPFDFPAAVASELPVRDLAQDDYLFREGELKRHVYRIETGALCVTACGAHGAPELIEIAYPGDIVGLGFLDRHIESAAALMATRVSVWSLQAIPLLTQATNETEARQSNALEREFLFRRKQLVASTADSPLRRVAAFLAVVSRLNEIEGRDPAMISESLRSDEVAAFLGVDIETLGAQLVELQRRGLVSQTVQGGLRLDRREELEALPDVL